jgi:hypothetical protein
VDRFGSERLGPLVTSLALVVLVSAHAADRTPDAIERSTKSALRACFKRAERDAAKHNVLVVPGLKSCYTQAFGAWDVATGQITARLLESGSPCAGTMEAIQREWNDYSAKLLGLQAIQDMAINTDDDLELALRKHLYELAYNLSSNTDCPR